MLASVGQKPPFYLASLTPPVFLDDGTYSRTSVGDSVLREPVYRDLLTDDLGKYTLSVGGQSELKPIILRNIVDQNDDVKYSQSVGDSVLTSVLTSIEQTDSFSANYTLGNDISLDDKLINAKGSAESLSTAVRFLTSELIEV